MKLKLCLLSVAAAAGLLLAPAGYAKSFKWASQGEIATWDIHSQNNALHDQVIPWAMKKNIEVVHRADNRIDMRTVKVN